MRILLTVLLLCGFSLSAAAADDWGQWQASTESNQSAIDHSAWDSWLRQHVDASSGSVNYQKVDKNAAKSLDKYISSLESTDPRYYNWAEQKAYWINLYNAAVVREILSHQPVSNVDDLKLHKNKVLKVAGNKMAVEDIRNNILLPIWKDYRVHFGLACGKMSCPGLANAAFTAANSRDLLKANGKRFVASKSGLNLDRQKNVLYLSALFKEHGDDFAPSKDKLIKTLSLYSPDNAALYLLGFNGKIDYIDDTQVLAAN